MAPNIRAKLRAIYGRAGMGVDATFTPSGGAPVSLRALDLTKGVDASKAGDLQTVAPAARIRMTELASAGITRSELRGGALLLNGTTWKVVSHKLRPLFKGESEGEVELTLRTP